MISNGANRVRVTYNKNHIALGTDGRNFAWFHPRKAIQHCHMHLILSGEARSEWVQKLDEVGIFAGNRGTIMKMRVNQKELTEHKELVRGVLAACEAMARS